MRLPLSFIMRVSKTEFYPISYSYLSLMFRWKQNVQLQNSFQIEKKNVSSPYLRYRRGLKTSLIEPLFVIFRKGFCIGGTCVCVGRGGEYKSIPSRHLPNKVFLCVAFRSDDVDIHLYLNFTYNKGCGLFAGEEAIQIVF